MGADRDEAMDRSENCHSGSSDPMCASRMLSDMYANFAMLLG